MRPSESANTAEQREMERRVRHMLARYAETLPASANVEAHVRQRLATKQVDSALRGLRPGWAAPTTSAAWARNAVSLGIVIALIVGFAAILRLHDATLPGVGDPSATATACATTGQAGAASDCQASGVTASVAVTQAYADSTRTAVALRITARDIPYVYSQADEVVLQNATLQDSHGHIVALAPGLGSNLTFGDTEDVATGYYEFNPLPDAMLRGEPQTLTLRIGQINLLVNQQHSVIQVTGPWQRSFQVTPQPGRSVPFQVAPLTRNGVTIQPLRLDIGPDANVFDGYGGGERLILRVSGLAPTTQLMALTSLSTAVTFPGGGGASADVAATLLLEGQRPASVGAANASTDAVVGLTGTVDLEIVFLSPPLKHLTGLQTLSIDRIEVAVDPTVQVVEGPWAFLLPLG